MCLPAVQRIASSLGRRAVLMKVVSAFPPRDGPGEPFGEMGAGPHGPGEVAVVAEAEHAGLCPP